MAGGAALIGSLLQAAVGDPTQSVNPAAGAYTVTPQMALNSLNASLPGEDDGYDTVEEAQKSGEDIKNTNTYLDRNGNDVTKYVKSPDDLLPVAKPNFFQRWFNPGQSDAANRINSGYAIQPLATTQAHDTTQGLAAKDFSRIQPAIGQNATSWSPNQGAIATGNNPTMAGIAGANKPSLEMGAQLPQTEVQTALNQNLAEQERAQNESRRLIADRAFGNDVGTAYNTSLRLGAENPMYQNMQTEEAAKGNLGEPTSAAIAKDTNNRASTALARNTIGNAPIAGALEASRLQGETNAQPDLNREIAAKAKAGATQAELEEQYLPYLSKAYGNEVKAKTYLSQFFPSPPPLSGRVNANDTVTPSAITGSPFTGSGMEDLMKRKALGGMVDTSSAGMRTTRLSNGNTVSWNPEVSILGNNIPQPDTMNDVKEASASSPIPIQGWPGFTQDSNGNVYKDGKLASDEETAMILQMTRPRPVQSQVVTPPIAIHRLRTY